MYSGIALNINNYARLVIGPFTINVVLICKCPIHLCYWVDVFKLAKIFFQNKYSHVYMLDKINRPAIAARISGIKNIIGPGLGGQKKWITSKNFLSSK